MSTKYLRVRNLEIDSELVMAMKPCWSREGVEQYLPPGTSLRIEEIIESEYISHSEKLWLVANILTNDQIFKVRQKFITMADGYLLPYIEKYEGKDTKFWRTGLSWINFYRLWWALQNHYMKVIPYDSKKHPSYSDYMEEYEKSTFTSIWKAVRNLKVHPVSEWTRAYYIELYMSQPGIWGRYAHS